MLRQPCGVKVKFNPKRNSLNYLKQKITYGFSYEEIHIIAKSGKWWQSSHFQLQIFTILGRFDSCIGDRSNMKPDLPLAMWFLTGM